jgi:glycosyltransferase involved in cell wall biosynthesis
MKIGYWLGSASIHGGGTSPYAWRILDLLLSSAKNSNIEIFVLCTDEVRKECIELINKHQVDAKISIIKSVNLIERFVKLLGVLLAKFLTKLKCDKKLLSFDPLYRWFCSLDIDVLYIPYQTAPVYELPYPYLVTMHDVQELHFPEFFSPEERAWRAEHYWKSLKYASGVIVSFTHVKQDLIKYFRLDESKVHVCPPPYNQINLTSPSQNESESYCEKYTGLKNFILYPAQTWEHKNHLALIKALEFIKDKYKQSVNLVCTGKKNIDYFHVIEKHLNTSPISEQVHFMDIVPEPELYWLYENCSLVVIPTLYEAGSFPLLEAMFLETPVICSNVTSLPDTIKDQRFIFDPLNIEQIGELIFVMLKNRNLIDENISNSRDRTKYLKSLDGFSCILNALEKTAFTVQ